jgi:hypothetical protein
VVVTARNPRAARWLHQLGPDGEIELKRWSAPFRGIVLRESGARGGHDWHTADWRTQVRRYQESSDDDFWPDGKLHLTAG